ncbi:hypothetical protein M2440_002494 [Methylorubrum extorquens]|nr:hypothetical protein [Methylorubrum extorquens]
MPTATVSSSRTSAASPSRTASSSIPIRPPGNGGETDAETTGIRVVNASGFTASHVTLQDSGTGIYLGQSPNAKLSYIEGHNFHGPFPGGQLVQFYQSPNGSLSDFAVTNDASHSHVEDNVSIIDSQNVSIANGVIDGNNSPSGAGVMFEGNSQGGHVQNVDVIHMSNGGFSSYSDDVSFVDTRSFDNDAGDQGRGGVAVERADLERDRPQRHDRGLDLHGPRGRQQHRLGNLLGRRGRVGSALGHADDADPQRVRRDGDR